MLYMKEKKSQKSNKNLFLPTWIIELLDREGDKMDGPGFVAAAAIYNFCNMTTDAKKEALSSYKDAEIERAYAVDDEQAAAQSVGEEQKYKQKKPPVKAG